MELKKADLVQRFIAVVIDSIIVSLVTAIIPVLGGLIGFAYTLCKDGVMYEILKKDEWKNKSIGKKLMDLEVVNFSGERVDLAVSAKRNIPLAIGNIIMVIPILGWIIGGLVGVVFGLIELFFVFTDENGRRLGDRWANTQVIQVNAADKEGDSSEGTDKL